MGTLGIGIAALLLLALPLSVSAACNSSFVDSVRNADRVFVGTVIGIDSKGVLPLRIDEIWHGTAPGPEVPIAVNYCGNRCTIDTSRSLRAGGQFLFSIRGGGGCIGALPMTAELLALRPSSAHPPPTVDAGLNLGGLVSLVVASIAGAAMLVLVTARLTDSGLRHLLRG